MKETNNKIGSALMMSILIMTSLLVVALSAANIVFAGIILTRVKERSTLAFFAAEAGAERALYEIRKAGFTPPNPNNDQSNVFGEYFLSNNSSYIVDYATNTPSVYYRSTGSYLGTKRNVEIGY